jgi:hypothetical protein
MNHYINYCQTTILHMQTEMESIVHELAEHPNPAFLENVLRLMKHIEQNWQAEFEWVRDIREQDLAKMETVQPGSVQADLA